MRRAGLVAQRQHAPVAFVIVGHEMLHPAIGGERGEVGGEACGIETQLQAHAIGKAPFGIEETGLENRSATGQMPSPWRPT